MPAGARGRSGGVSGKHRTEYVLFCFFRGLIRRLPAGAAYRVLEMLALVMQEGFGWRKQGTRERLREVFPERSEEEREGIRREAVRNLARNMVDLIKGPESCGVQVEGADALFKALERAREREKGVLLVIAHSGNWDHAGIVTARGGFPMCFIARHQKNSRMYRELIRAREEGGGTVVDRDDPRLIRKLLAFLAENGVVAILVDIRARKAGDTYRFLGRTAWLGNGLGLLAAKSGAEVLPVYLGRDGRRLHFWKPLSPRRLKSGAVGKPERRALLQSCLDDLSAEILLRPEAYFWFNKRWVLEPFDEDV